jgi:hypothetical protein
MTDHPTLTGLFGSATALGAVMFSFLPHIEQWLRLGSLTIGILVGIISLVNLIRKWNK